MSYKVILVPFSGLEDEIPALNAAISQAKKSSADVIGLHFRQHTSSSASLLSFPLPEGYPDEVETDFSTASQRVEEQARARFEGVARAEDFPVVISEEQLGGGAAMCVSKGGDAGSALAIYARAADLIALPLATHSEQNAELQRAAIFQSGVPVLLVPASLRASGRPRKALIAWNGSFEAARAVKLALPALMGVQVKVYTVEEGSAGCAGSRIAAYLRRHGVEVSAVATKPAGRDVTASILAAAKNFGAELLVMGAFCRETRLREALLGGFTQDMLAGSALPILLSN